MGNKHPKPSKLEKKWHSTQTTFSIASNVSNYSTYSTSRPWSRSSRRKWKESTLENAMNASKTAWPVSMVESMFLPEFPVKPQVDESHFEIVEKIARGAFGKVLKVVKKDTGETFAMKILSKSQAIKENAVQQCKDEVSIQLFYILIVVLKDPYLYLMRNAALRKDLCYPEKQILQLLLACDFLNAACGLHPFIVHCKFRWQNRRQLFLVSDYISFGELLLLWKKYKKLPEPVVQIYLAELAIAIDYLHNSGIIYRDLKMDHVLLDENGHVKLIDFGFAKWLHHGSRTRTICGTIQYMAPEILRGETYTHAVDWWSLGIIIYSLLIGHVSFSFPVEKVPEVEKMCDLVTEFNYSLPADEFNYDLRSCLQRLLCKDPNRRLASLYQLKWENYMKKVDLNAVENLKVSPKIIFEEYLRSKEKKKPVANGNAVNGEVKMIENFSWTESN